MNQQAVILHLLREGQWHQAVLLYREETGVPKRLAAREVERIAEQHQIRPARPWLWWPTQSSQSTETTIEQSTS